MDVKRQSKIDCFRFDKDKRLSLGVGVLLEHAFELHGIVGVQLVQGEFGKLHVESAKMDDKIHGDVCEVAPSSLNFNLSHSGEIALCAFSPCSVGCDVEKIKDAPLNIAPRVFTPAEQEVLNTLAGDEQKLQFYKFWTAKEAVIKMTGEGFSRDPRTFSVLQLDAGLHNKKSSQPAIGVSVNTEKTIQVISGRKCSLFTFLCDNNHIASVCVEGEHCAIELSLKEIDLSAI